MTGIEIKQNFKSFPPKVPQMQPIENPWRLPKLQKINEAVYLWFHSLTSRGPPTSELIIKENHKILFKKFPDKNEGFKASEGWLHKWKTFYCICQLNVNGGKLFADEVKATLYYDELADTIFDHGYYMDQIFNIDE